MTGVSVATLNSALSELEAQKLIVRKHGVGVYVSRTLHQKCVCLICDPSFFGTAGVSPFWDLLVEQMRQRAEVGAEAFSFHLSMPASTAAKREVALHDGLIQEIKSGCVQGIISVGLDEDISHWIEAQGVPNVAFAGPGPYLVMIDSEDLVRLGVAQLIEQGCRKLAFWQVAAPRRPIVSLGGPTPESSAFADSLLENGIALNPKLVRFGTDHLSSAETITTETSQEQGYRVAMEVFSSARKSFPDGIVINDDLMTRGALTALAKLGIRAGRDVKIATHANRDSSVLMGHEDELTLVEIDPSEVVQAIFDMLETLMNGQTPPQNCISIAAKLRS
jgi:DNA-binding LacI/PurR family transcriptional regulator